MGRSIRGITLVPSQSLPSPISSWEITATRAWTAGFGDSCAKKRSGEKPSVFIGHGAAKGNGRSGFDGRGSARRFSEQTGAGFDDRRRLIQPPGEAVTQ